MRRIKTWNVVCRGKDGSILFSYSMGVNKKDAEKWFKNATYIKASSECEEIIEIVESDGDTFNTVRRELKRKYQNDVKRSN